MYAGKAMSGGTWLRIRSQRIQRMRMITLRAVEADSRDDLVMRWIGLTILVTVAGCADDRCPQGLVARGLGVCHVPDEVAGLGGDERPVTGVEWSQAGAWAVEQADGSVALPVGGAGRGGGDAGSSGDAGSGGGQLGADSGVGRDADISGRGGRDAWIVGGTGGMDDSGFAGGGGGIGDEVPPRGAQGQVAIHAPRCGDGHVDPGELCDGDCPVTCDDADPCTKDSMTGSTAKCSVACTHSLITAAATGDGCCPAGASAGTDPDCMAVCGNGAVEPGEICDGNCPVSCDDNNPCTEDVLSHASACSVLCSHRPAASGTSCGTGKVCDANARCVEVQLCGNGKLDPGEYCDDSSSSHCPSCTGSNPCVTYSAHGSATYCSLRCDSQPKPAGTSCGGSNICKASGTCGAPSALYQGCAVTADCGRDLVCLDGQCSVRCAGATSSCPPRNGASATCRSFHSESQGVCRLDCQQDSTCGAGWKCSGTGDTGFCVPADVPGAN